MSNRNNLTFFPQDLEPLCYVSNELSNYASLKHLIACVWHPTQHICWFISSNIYYFFWDPNKKSDYNMCRYLGGDAQDYLHANALNMIFTVMVYHLHFIAAYEIHIFRRIRGHYKTWIERANCMEVTTQPEGRSPKHVSSQSSDLRMNLKPFTSAHTNIECIHFQKLYQHHALLNHPNIVIMSYYKFG